METWWAHSWHTGQVVSDWILTQSQEVAQNQFPEKGLVWMALLQSFARVEEQCAHTLEKDANQVPEIMAQHVAEDQVGVFLAALYQLICTQQQGITSMVVAQAGVPLHLGDHTWAAMASMTRLFTQVILGLGSLPLQPLSPGARQCQRKLSTCPYLQRGTRWFQPGYFPESRSVGMAWPPILFTWGTTQTLGYHP